MGPEPFYRYGLASIAGVLPLYLVRFSVFGIPTNILEALIACFLVAGILQKEVRQSWKHALGVLPKPFLTFLALFTVAVGVSAYISPHLFTSLGILKGWILIPLTYAFLLYSEMRRDVERGARYQSLVAGCLVVSGLVVALIGFSQVGMLNRIRSVYDVPNSLALFISPLIVLNLLQPLPHLRRMPALVMGVALLGTQSLGGILSVAAVLAVYGFMHRLGKVSKRSMVTIGLVVAVSLVVVLPKILYLSQAGSSAHVRLQLWSVSVELIQENPVLGIGLGVFEPFYQEKLHERFAVALYQPLPEFVFRDPHNWILSFWLNTGFLGLVAFAGLHAWILVKDRLTSPVSYVLISILLFGLIDTVYWKNDLSAMHWVLIVLLLTSPVLKAGELGANGVENSYRKKGQDNPE